MLAHDDGMIHKEDFMKWWHEAAWHATEPEYDEAAWFKVGHKDLPALGLHRAKEMKERDLQTLMNMIKKFKARYIDPDSYVEHIIRKTNGRSKGGNKDEL